MVDINSTLTNGITQLEPLITTINTLVSALKLLLGGVFGIYLLLLIMRWWESRSINKTLKVMKIELIKTREIISKIEDKLDNNKKQNNKINKNTVKTKKNTKGRKK